MPHTTDRSDPGWSYTGRSGRAVGREETPGGGKTSGKRHLMKGFADLADLPEDRRIALIGQAAMAGDVVAFVVDTDPGKADRYVRKLLEKFPELEEESRFTGPIAGAVTVKVRKKKKTGGTI